MDNKIGSLLLLSLQVFLAEASIKCKSQVRNFKKIKTSDEANAALKDALNLAVATVFKEYNSQLKGSSRMYSTGLTKKSAFRQKINATVKQAETDIEGHVAKSISSVEAVCNDSKSKKIDKIHSEFSKFCETLEWEMRLTIARVDIDNATAVNRRSTNNIGEYVDMVRPEIAEKMVTAAVNLSKSKTQEDLFEAGYGAIAKLFNNQMDDYRQKILRAVSKLERKVGETSTRVQLVVDDLDEVKTISREIISLLREKIIEMRTFHPGLRAPEKTFVNVIRHIRLLYDEILGELNKKGNAIFELMYLVEYDLTH